MKPSILVRHPEPSDRKALSPHALKVLMPFTPKTLSSLSPKLQSPEALGAVSVTRHSDLGFEGDGSLGDGGTLHG